MGIYNSNFDFNKYRAFYAVSECKSFSKAVNLLHISQPAISHSIKELEEQLGTKLFIRENKSVRLTDNGKKLLQYVEKAFNNIVLAERVLTETEGELNGNIRIGIYSHISLFMLPKLISQFVSKNPKATFDIYSSSTQELREKLKNRELDIIILQYPVFINEDDYTEEILCELENCFFSNKEFYDLYMSNNKLAEYPLMLPRRGYDDINALEEMFKRKNMILKNNYRVYTIELAKKLAIEGVGIGWGLKKCVEKEIKNKQLYEIPIDFKIPTTKFSVCYKERYLNQTAIAFLKDFKEYINKEFNNKLSENN